MKIEKILFTTKVGQLDFHDLESLFPLKRAGLREVILYYVIPREEVGFVPYGGYLKEEEERIREEARIRFEDWRRSLSSAGLSGRIAIEVGDPVPNILSLAERERVDLIVVGKKKMTGRERLFSGSHTLSLIIRSRVPTLVNKHLVEFDSNGETVTRINDRIFTRPLLATDWSGPSEKAIRLLLSLSGIVEQSYVCHVIGVRISKGREVSELLRMERESRDRLDQYCARLNSAGIPATPRLGAGRSPLEIIRISRETEIVEDDPALANGVEYAGEIVVGKHHVGRLFRHVRSAYARTWPPFLG